MIYRVLKPLLLFALRQFFSAITIRGTPCEHGALLVVGNHPNLALDSMVISSGYRRDLWYLGKATLFRRRWMRAILEAMHVAPLYRRQDDPSLMAKNDETFRAVANLLKKGRGVLLFPEGVSLGERNLAPLKTGAARMAFQAESESDFELELRIQAVGITYSDLDTFRSRVTIVYGEPFDVRQFQSTYLQDPRGAVQELTTAIEERLKSVAVSIADREHEGLVEDIAKVYRSTLSPLDERDRFAVIARNVEALAPMMPEQKALVQREIGSYLADCRAINLEGDSPLSAKPYRALPYLLIASPLIIVGFVIHYPVYRLVGELVRRTASRQAYEASGKFLFGLVLFPLWYLLCAAAGGLALGSWLSGVGILAILAVSGYVVNRSWEAAYLLVLNIPGVPRRAALRRLVERRDRLVKILDAMRIE